MSPFGLHKYNGGRPIQRWKTS